MFSELCDRFDLLSETLGDRELASTYILNKDRGLMTIGGRSPDALVIDAGTWANPDLKSAQLSDWSAGAAAAGLAAGLGFALFSGDVDGEELQSQLTSLTHWDAEHEPFIGELAQQAEELHQETLLAAEQEEGDYLEDEEDCFGFGFIDDSDGNDVGEYADNNYGGRYYEGGDLGVSGFLCPGGGL